MRQPSAWGQSWFDLSGLHDVHGCAIYTPLCSTRQTWRKPYYSTWYKMIEYQGRREAVYFSIEGETMIEMLRDGLTQTRCLNLRTRALLLAVALEQLERKFYVASL